VGGSGCDRAAQNCARRENTQDTPEMGKHTNILQSELSSVADQHGKAAQLTDRCVQMKYLGGRRKDSGARFGRVCDGTNATRVMDRENGTSSTELGKPAAQQAAHANKQQPSTQLRSEAGGVSACLH
jgi:hypothetical protein